MEDYKLVKSLRKKGLKYAAISRTTNIPQSTIKIWLIKGALPKRYSKKSKNAILKNLNKAKLVLKRLKEKKLKELSNKINSDFAYVLGSVLGDGYIQIREKNSSCVRISVRDEDFAQSFYKALKNWSGLNCRIYFYRGFWRVYSSSIVVAKALKNFDLSRLRKMPRRIVYSFLRGLYDAEGNVNGRKIRFYNSDIRLIRLVVDLLTLIGIKNIYLYKRASEMHVIEGRKYKVKPVYTLEFSGEKNIKLFYKMIGFSLRRKEEKLENAISFYKEVQIRQKKLV
jgi:intein-encoded DNA endonuclease-like protein